MAQVDKDSKKEPNATREGAWAAAGFAVVLVVVGLPVWWYTTTVYRAHLPYGTIQQLSRQLRYHGVGMTLVGVTDPAFTMDLERQLKSMRSIKFLLAQRRPEKEELKIIRATDTLHDLDEKLTATALIASGTLGLFILSESDSRVLDAANVSIAVGRHRLIFVKPEVDMTLLSSVIKDMVINTLASKKADGNKVLHELKGQQRKEAMRQVPTEPGYDVTLTLMVPEPQLISVNWDAKKAVSDYLKPFAKQVQSISEISIRSQVLYMTGLNVSPQWSSSYSHFALPEEQLPLTINAIEAKLGSYVRTRPSLHFVVYIPRVKQAPLFIHKADGTPLEINSFMVPRWGGVMIHNVPALDVNASYPQSVELDTHWIMTTVLTHLHKLLPVPTVKNEESLLLMAPKESCKLADWQLDGLARARVSSYLANIRITLQSLCELVGEISNMVISDEVGGWVWGAVEEWGECGRATREGRLQEATLYCSRSFMQADAAFFHPSMLALLYFPDNQKYAIYVPLFLPVSIPVILSLKVVLGLYKKQTPQKVKSD
ncbi:GPI transamidase component PIG-S [Macrobrachium rosenbergii]|uniref:GPI transamidase component PIG-S n=1 Tax=Macrobrachium rosenbergii TaxID=79674 RepID=UPI0034D4E293